jgi:hypothetical protein
MESGGAFAMLVIVAVAVYFVGVDLGLLPDLPLAALTAPDRG